MNERGIYRKGLVSIGLIILSILASIAIVHVDIDKMLLRNYRFEHILQPDDHFGAYPDEGGYKEKENDEVVDYAIRKTEVVNYELTKEFAQDNPNVFVVQTSDHEIHLFDKYAEFPDIDELLAPYDVQFTTRDNNYQEPIIETKLITNIESLQSELGNSKSKEAIFDPSTIKIDKEKEGLISQTFTAEKEDLTIKESTEIGTDSFENAVSSSLDSLTKVTGTWFGAGTISVDGYTSVNVNDDHVVNLLKSEMTASSLMLKAIVIIGIALVLTIIFATVLNYEKTMRYDIYGGKNIPIELYLLVALTIFSMISLSMDRPLLLRYASIFEQRIEFGSLILYIGLSALTFVISYMTFYGVFSLKSVGKEGFASYVFGHSIIAKAFRFTKKTVKNAVKFFFGGLNITSKFLWGFILFVCVFSSFLISVLLFGDTTIALIIAALVTYVFYRLRVYLYDFREIEEVSELIASGDYHKKIDEEQNVFQKLSKNLNKAGDSLSLAIGKELKSERMKTELITNVSHDLKTPLTSIINYSELLQDDNASQEELREYGKVINEKSHKLKDLIESLFEISKVSSKNVELNYMNLDIRQILEQNLGQWLDKYDEKSLEVVINLPEKPVIISLDGQYASRILDNIFSNIYKYSLEHTRVYIDLYDGESSRLVVKNISKYALNISAEELMERFTRGDESRSTEGSGLGLSIASSLTELMGGHFEIEIVGDVFKVEIDFGQPIETEIISS